MIYAVSSDKGKVRKNNEDNYFALVREQFGIFGVADGMGGHNAGEIASGLACNTMLDFLKEQSFEKNIDGLLKEAVELANKTVFEKAISSKKLSNMGTTLTTLITVDHTVHIAHVGDSRAYLIRNNTLKQITVDHSYVEELLKIGAISKEEAENHPKKNEITRAVGVDFTVDVDTFKLKTKAEDIILMCSDGLSNMLTDAEILKTLSVNCDIKKATELLVKKANDKGGMDNITVIIVKF